MSESVKALALALRSGPPQMACCTRCGEPLIPTMDWSFYEFYCLCCGNHLGFVEPRGKDETPELLARYEELEAEWKEHAAGIIPQGQFGLKSCEQCDGRTNHRDHITDEEIEADRLAREWLAERAKS